ncbi:hypothetical protein V1478_005426 [Vespula squamosa]|uniref:Uncharacterized protein n=1 Tax=Vespula squamosa TaxID=30214 RepID=A0ABD2BEX4_VESSQ
MWRVEHKIYVTKGLSRKPALCHTRMLCRKISLSLLLYAKSPEFECYQTRDYNKDVSAFDLCQIIPWQSTVTARTVDIIDQCDINLRRLI